MKMVTRAQWNARNATCHTSLPASLLRGIAIHYSAADSDEEVSHANCASRVKGIQNFHMSKAAGGGEGPWCDIAYNFIVCRHGYVFVGRGYDSRSAAQGTNDGNDHYIAICFLGADKVGRDDVLPAGRAALSDFINSTNKKYNKVLEVRPHNSFHSTGCPGKELEAYIQQKGWKIEKPKWPFAGAPKRFWQWNEWRLAGRPSPRPTNLPRPGSPILVKYWAWARKYDAYVKKQN